MCTIVTGRLGRDAEISETSKGNKFVKFSVAQNEYRNGEDKTTWYDVVSYDPYVIEKQIKALKKGNFVVVVGGLDVKISVGKTGTIYQNYNITAWKINVLNLGGNGKTENDGSETVSNENSQSTTTEEKEEPTPTISIEALKKKEKETPTPTPMSAPTVTEEGEGDDDLPF